MSDEPRSGHRAKIFKNGRSQAVRLPKECRFPDTETEVVARKEGKRVILEPLEGWSEAFLETAGSCPDFERPEQPLLSEARDPFAE